MFKRIFVSSLKQVLDYPMLVRIAFLTGFVETIAAFWRFGNLFYVILKKNINIASLQGSLGEYLNAIFEVAMDNLSFGSLALIGILALIGYVFLYPIGHGMMISYAQTQSGTKAFRVSWERYFTITIAQATLSVLTLGSWHLLAFRYVYDWGILNNILVQILLVLIGGFVMVMSFLYAYTNVSTVIDEFGSSRPIEQAQEALKHSATLALKYPWVTIKFLFLSLLLQVRFFVTTVFVIGVPALVIWFLMQIGLIRQEAVVDVVLVTAGVLLLASVYINSVIDAFFAVYWYKLYSSLQTGESE